MPEYHVPQDLGAVVVVFVAVLHKGEPVHVAHVRLPVGPEHKVVFAYVQVTGFERDQRSNLCSVNLMDPTGNS